MLDDIIISVENLCKKYGRFKAVEQLSFQVKRGEIFGLLGPNGAGKSTTLEIMEMLRSKTSGKVFIDGMDIDKNATDIKEIIGVQLQNAGYYPRLKLTEIIHLFAGLYNRKVDARNLLAKMQLQDKANNLFKELSGGQKQRFSLAITLINHPKIIFLDEPTTGLDPQARRNLWRLIQDIKAMGTTIIITTHYMDEAEVLCDRVAIMDSGKLIRLATPEELIDDLLLTGFKKDVVTKPANLEDVFIHLTGKHLRDI